MKIENHRLVASDPSEQVSFQLDEVGPVLLPKIAVIHYAVTESAGATASVLKARDYVSCHVTVDRNGRVIQQVPFDRVAYHAGQSVYAERKGVNNFSLGIEVSNPGPLIKGPDGKLRTVYGAIWGDAEHERAIEAKHKSGVAPKEWTHWAEFSDREFDLCAQIVDLWRATYGITDVVGHDDVCIPVGRKFDPGPAFPIDALRRAVFGAQTTTAP